MQQLAWWESRRAGKAFQQSTNVVVSIHNGERSQLQFVDDMPAYVQRCGSRRRRRVADVQNPFCAKYQEIVHEAPFGGVKASGQGREGGRYGVEAYLDHKYLSWALD